MKPIIRVENLSKQYRIGAKQAPYATLRESLSSAVTAPFRRFRNPANNGENTPQSDTIWALRDVSFEVQPGEVVGIIGRNGAGKSTLLKILSRITEPTEGRVDLYGRVASLLEVGTGFHAELTGRENIYLNGAILGMKYKEIERHFDEIVAFAEVEKFIDTPVKRYSSGMYLRLAFAVAAHLDPEILVVDEVLAVGDAEFQKKCLGKMEEVSRDGRTVFFISHNLQAIKSLCTRAIQLISGVVSNDGEPGDVIGKYNLELNEKPCRFKWPESDAPGNDEFKLTSVRIFTANSIRNGIYSSNEDIYVEFEFIAMTVPPSLCIGFDLITTDGDVVTRSYQTDLSPSEQPKIAIGKNTLLCKLPSGLLNAGSYCICPRVGLHNLCWIIHMDAVVKFEVRLEHGVSPFWGSLSVGNRPGVIAPLLNWRLSVVE